MRNRTVGLLLVSVLALIGGAKAQAGRQGPCDIYAAARTPCVAAHSTTRALFGAYVGPLYQLKRPSDGKTLDIGVIPGGFANAPALSVPTPSA